MKFSDGGLDNFVGPSLFSVRAQWSCANGSFEDTVDLLQLRNP
jgi:hypothetical protein